MTIYTRAKALADRQLLAKGQVGAIRRKASSPYSPSHVLSGDPVVTDYPANMALFPVNQKDIDGTFIKAGDWRVLVATEGLTITPTTTDQLVTTEGVLTIVDAGKFSPAGTVTHYKMVARK